MDIFYKQIRKTAKKIALKLVINCIVLKSNIMLYLPTTDLVVNTIIVRRNHYADNGKNNDNFHLKCKQFYFLFYRNELILGYHLFSTLPITGTITFDINQ